MNLLKNFVACLAVVAVSAGSVFAQVPADLDTTLAAQTSGVGTLATAGITAGVNILFLVMGAALVFWVAKYGIKLVSYMLGASGARS